MGLKGRGLAGGSRQWPIVVRRLPAPSPLSHERPTLAALSKFGHKAQGPYRCYDMTTARAVRTTTTRFAVSANQFGRARMEVRAGMCAARSHSVRCAFRKQYVFVYSSGG